MIVSVCIIAYNEENALPHLLSDIVSQDYEAEKMELVLVDSHSNDGTRRLMEAFKNSHPEYLRVKIETNRGKNQASGWNTAIRASEGDVVIRLDAHGRIPKDFVRKNVECLESGEYVSGGPRPNLPESETPWQNMLLLAESSMFGSGIAGFRQGKGKKYVRSMFHAAYRREVLDTVGEFNEDLGRTEDNEFHYRIRKAGYSLCYDPQIHSWQYIRSSLPKMMKQKFGNGYWVALTVKECPGCLGIYHFVPFAFVMGIIVTAVRARLGKPFMAIAMWVAYWITAIAMAFMAVKDEAKHLCQMLLPVVFFLLHVSYGIGSLIGFLKMPFWKKKGM